MENETLFESKAMNYNASDFLEYVSKPEIRNSLVQEERDFIVMFRELYEYIKLARKPSIETLTNSSLDNFEIQQQSLRQFNLAFHEHYCKIYNSMKHTLSKKTNEPDTAYLQNRLNNIHLLKNIVSLFCEKYQEIATL